MRLADRDRDHDRDIALVVDDSPETLSFMTDALEESGISVLVARDAGTALTLLGRVTPDVILLDAVMPGLNGFETCRRLKQDHRLSQIPVIFMTGLSDTENVVKGLRAGGVDYLTKPIAPDELLARVGVHIANARITQSARDALDVTGRSVIAVASDGSVVWSTPHAAALLGPAGGARDGDVVLDPAMRQWMVACAERALSAVQPRRFERPARGAVELSYLGRHGLGELLFRVSDGAAASPAQRLQTRLQLTAREAEVLNWLAQGKSNRDIGAILSLSPRTVNKHLEQIYVKLEVENRTAAAVLAIRTIEGA
ncbi:DNA-binding response regulator [Pelagibius sp. 7325]|uniref:DNA-binding response regulator n=1 Tax=Pelagibius sp. 7325 TaxID=3131994 RepID=UPI0030EDEACF